MNERIKELAIKYADENRPGSFVKYDPLWFEHYNLKFTELLVQECIAECWYDATPKQISDNIKMKFGVE